MATTLNARDLLESTACHHCGLPVPAPLWGRRPTATDGPLFCCLGCRVAAAVAPEGGAEARAHWMLAKLGLATFCTLNVMVFTMVLWTHDVYEPGAAGVEPLAPVVEELFRYICLVCALPVLFLLGRPLAESGWQEWRRGTIGTDWLLLCGVIAAFAFSIWSVFTNRPHIYFEVGCVVLLAVTLGRWFESTLRLESSRALQRLAQLMPERVRRVSAVGEMLVLADDLQPGERFRVMAGERFAADGRLLSGTAAIDEQWVTGESSPAVKSSGDMVFGGALNIDGDLLVEATSSARGGSLARIVEAVHEARLAQGHYQRLAERVSRWFGAGVLVIALLVLAGHSATKGWQAGMLGAMSVVLIACPCALAVATPLAVWTALQRAAQFGIVFRSGEALERLARIDAVRFDKTGTLTTGSPIVLRALGAVARDVEPCDWELIAATAHRSTHPLARALAAYALERVSESRIASWSVAESRTISGRGISATLENHDVRQTVYLGSTVWVESCGQQFAPAMQAALLDAERDGAPTLAFGIAGSVRGLFVFRERLRDGAADSVEWLKTASFDLGVLTGDRSAQAGLLVRGLGVPVSAGLSPEEKVSELKQVRAAGKHVAMVGDGVNDAPALAAADVGISMGCGTDLARDTAGVCLLGDDLGRLVTAIELARYVVRIVRQNLFWALIYNAAGVGLAAAGLLNPIVAAIAMVASSTLVVGNTLRLREWCPPSEASAATCFRVVT